MNEFDDLADLDDVFGPLRSVARSAELSQESATVDLMVNAHRTSEGKHMLTSRRARIATLVATGVLGFGGMAAASPDLGGNDPEVEKAIVEESVEEQVVEVPVAEEPIVEEPVVEEELETEEPETEEPVVEVPAEPLPPKNDLDTDSGLLKFPCKEGNHGKTVSAVAHGDIPGVSVTDAAHSSCGKNEPKVDGDDSKDEKPEVGGPDSEVEQPEVDEPEIDDDSDDDSDDSKVKADRPDKSDKGAEKAANGNGNGNRNRDD